MKRLTLFAVVMLVVLSRLSSMATAETPQRHMVEINRLAEQIANNSFEPLTVVADGETLDEAFAKAAFVVRDYIGLRKLSPELCNCFTMINIVPFEECAFIKKWDYNITETVGENRQVKLVLRLNNKQLKQLAYFALWPLQNKRFKS